MNSFEVWDPTKGPDVSFRVAEIDFPAYEVYADQAKTIAEYICSLEVTEDNIKEVKKELAKCRKVTDELNKRRIAIKKDILAEFGVFESQVKTLIFIVDNADSQLRAKVRQMEEAEREEKKARIREIWDKRIGLYRIGAICADAFDIFLKPKHLNKTTPIKAVEKAMTDWLEQTEKDLEVLAGMGVEYEAEYVRCLDMAKAIATVNDRKAQTDIVRAAEEDTQEEEVLVIAITGRKDIEFTKVLLDVNGINYKEVK